jgi:hypothetical protein
MKTLNLYQVRDNIEWMDKCIEGVTGESSVVRALKNLTPLLYAVALANIANEVI